MISIVNHRVLGVLSGAAVACGAAAPRAGADAVNVPPVVVTSLAHTWRFDAPPIGLNQTVVQDSITIPGGPGTWTGPGFSASIGTGDTVVVRIEAPAGKQFTINSIPGAIAVYFDFYLWWGTGVSDTGSSFPAATVTLEGFSGSAPTNTYTLSGVSDNGNAIVVNRQYTMTGACGFTALQMVFPVTHALADVMRTYGPVNTFSSPSLSATAVFSGNNPASPIVMSLDPIPTPGACCHGTTCTVVLPLDCMAGGVSLGSNSACNPPVRGGTINACCPADFNGSGTVSVQDVFDYLAAYFHACP